ncbi:hypothetical protein [Sutcliffiella cohnii]|uniref:hypothetical protein n=1 Tax=Sutcliffiella cohnii TaxID=33932 RepID=UPI002E1B267A|nr:hypothetical protein [Sutcliffiella cohnii]
MNNVHKNILHFSILIILIFIPGCNTLQDNNNEGVAEDFHFMQDNNNEVMPEDFHFSLTYGTYGKQKIDTFHDIVVKDLVKDGTIEANISLTMDEKHAIYNEMMKIGIMNELKLEKEEGCGVEPPSISQWFIQMNGETKSFSYMGFCDYTEDALALVKLEDYIHKVVSSKEEYRELPESNGYYE